MKISWRFLPIFLGGIIKDKDNVVAEYSPEEISQPIGIAKYELEVALGGEYRKSLPTIEELE